MSRLALVSLLILYAGTLRSQETPAQEQSEVVRLLLRKVGDRPASERVCPPARKLSTEENRHGPFLEAAA